MTATPTRSTAAVWRPGDPVGDRRFVSIGDLPLERGGELPGVTVAYETWGTRSPRGVLRTEIVSLPPGEDGMKTSAPVMNGSAASTGIGADRSVAPSRLCCSGT